MASLAKRQHALSLLVVMLVLVAVLPSPVGSQAASAAPEEAAANAAQALPETSAAEQPSLAEVRTPVNCTSTACPTAPSGLDKCVERTDFCVYYTDSSITETEAEWAADIVQMYWDRFVALGFDPPKHSGRLEVHLSDTTDCNGGTGWSSNAISTYAGCFSTDLLAQKVLGHELTHRVQYSHDDGGTAPVQTKFLKEGTARATEDNWFLEIDNWAAALSFSSFNSETNNYLVAAFNDITSYAMRYKSCLWWKYAMEQYGTTAGEPQLGVDFVFEVLEQNGLGYSGIAAVNRALNVLGAGVTFDVSFKQFAVANWTKDLSGVPDSSYNYHDEDEAGNPGAYGPVVPDSGGTIQVGSPATWTNEWVDRYGIRYYEADIGANCPVISASFAHDYGPAFYHVVTQNGSAFNTHVQGGGGDWSPAFLNDGVTKVVAITGSLGSSSESDITLSCADPDLEIMMPNSGAVARVQANDKFLVQVSVTDGAGGPVVAGLTNSDFSATVDGTTASVVGGGFIQEQYWLLLEAPSLADGTYPLAVTLETTPAASDTNADSVVYTADRLDQVLVIDRSGSMVYGTVERLPAAKDAASFYVDVTRIGDGLAVVPYHTTVDPEPWHMREVTDQTVRDAAQSYINGLGGGSMTSIGAGLDAAVKERGESPTGNPLCSFVLLSDGMENTSPMWADVMAAVQDTGCPVTTIAFGPASDETLMQNIATATGGLYFYNDVYSSIAAAGVQAAPSEADMNLDLANTYEYAEGLGEGRQRLLAEKGEVSEKIPKAEHTVYIDETLTEAVFSLDWFEPYYAELDLTLIREDGTKFDSTDPGYSFIDPDNMHLGFRLRGEDLEPGTWTLVVTYGGSELGNPVPYQVLVSGQTRITLHLLLPDRLGVRYTTGNRVPIYALLTAGGPIPDAVVEAFVTAPDGTRTRVMLSDDGQHGDGMPRDGLYAGLYTLVTQASTIYPQGEEGQSEPNDEGGYRVLARATHPKFVREALGAFSVLEGADDNDNRLPDVWEEENRVSDPFADPDGDGLPNYREYQNGTDPHDPDTDDGGEKDGSEVTYGRNPLDPADDGIKAPSFFQVRPVLARSPQAPVMLPAVQLRYDWQPDYDQMWAYQATSPDGPWSGPLQGLDNSGVYTDTSVQAGMSYWYRIEGIGGLVRQTPVSSAVLTSGEVTPSADPYPPEAHVLINGGAWSTTERDVTLSFIPYEAEGEDPLAVFEDITLMKISNDPSFAGASWQPFQEEGVPWQLDAERGEIAKVYALFRDGAANESAGPEVGRILYAYHSSYLPVVLKGH
ncbi:MAG: VWA domain-containing protein [Anaerolineae bacterium]|nr:VWA domain-containing protein [Anaerolineae bacterium]